MTPEIRDRIKAAYGSGEQYDLTVRSFEADRKAQIPAGATNRLTTVTRLITATSTCIYAQVVRDFRPVGGTRSGVVDWVGLWRRTVLDDPVRHNPTPWFYVIDGILPDGSEPPNPCAGP